MLGTMLSVCLVASLPCLVFKYLPMTDLPQHEAIVSIMRHMHDPAYGYNRYYEWALDRTLYVFPYFLAVGLSLLLPVKLALHLTVFAATFSYPLGVLLTLRALKRPLVLTLLALPLIYNRSFFWGFINFNLAIGIAFIALSQLVGPWSRKKGWLVAGLCLLSAMTHVYGLIMLWTYALAWLLVGERRQLLSRVIWFFPAAVAVACWGIFAANAPGYGVTEWAPFDIRLRELGNSILGGYKDKSEDFILCAWIVTVILLAFRGFPVTFARWKRLGVHCQASYVLIVANLVAYFVLPVATPTAKFIHFRHAVMSAMLLPFIVSEVDYLIGRVLVRSVPPALSALVIGNTWWHLWRFEQEASEFDAILAAVPARCNLVQLTYDSKGEIMRSHAYLHFGAYAQAEKGGVFAVSFPILFWNIPLKGRANSGMPETPKNMEWSPGRFDEYRMGHFYDGILVRQSGVKGHRTAANYGYDLAAAVGPWKLYRRVRFI